MIEINVLFLVIALYEGVFPSNITNQRLSLIANV